MATMIESRNETNLMDDNGFTPEDHFMFKDDDLTAGRTIGKILCTLFFYSLLAMSVVIWWSFRVIF